MSSLPEPLRIEEIVAHQDFLRALARRLVCDVARADDLVQETWVRALDAPARRPRRLGAWLARVVTNLAHDVVLLHHFQGLTVAEVVARLAIPLETARTRLRRALQQLREQLERDLGGRDALLAALLPLARFEPPALATAAAATLAGGSLLLGVPLAMTTTTKLTVAALSAVLIGSLWLFAGDALGLRGGGVGDGVMREALSPPAIVGNTAVDATLAVPVVAGRERLEPPASATASAEAVDRALASLHVRTIWLGGGPAPAIRLRVVQRGTDRGFDALRRAATDAAGELLLTGLPPGECVVAAAGFTAEEKPGEGWIDPAVDSRSACKVVLLAPGAIGEVTLALPAGRAIRGRVVDGGSRPVAGARIWVSDTDDVFSAGDFAATSDERGEFTLGAVGWYHFAAAESDGGARSEVVSVDANQRSEDDRLELVIDRPGATIRGLVSDEAGEPIAGAMVLAVDDSRGSRLTGSGRILGDPPPIMARTDVSGAFELRAVPGGEIALLASDAVHAPSWCKVAVEPGPDLDHDFLLGAGSRLDVLLLDDHGAPVVGAAVEMLLIAGSLQLASLTPKAKADAAGHAVFERLPAAGARLSASAPGFVAVNELLDLAGSGAEHRDLLLRRALALRGRVVDDAGRGVAAIRVELVPVDLDAASVPGDRTTDVDGRFEVFECADVDYEVTLFHPDSLFAARRAIRLHPRPEEHLLTLGTDHRQASTIVGRIVDLDGQPVAGPHLQFAETAATRC